MTVDIKEAVKDGRKVRFMRFFNNELWYATETGFEFPVPVDDVGNATFLAEDKALMFMRWMRKHAAMLDRAKTETQVNQEAKPAAMYPDSELGPQIRSIEHISSLHGVVLDHFAMKS